MIIRRSAVMSWSLVALVALATVGRGQDTRFEFPNSSRAVRDTAKVFSPEAVQKATAEINRVERETKASILVETVESVGDEPVKAVAATNARRWGRHGIYILIDKKDHRFEVMPTPGFEKVVDAEDVQVFRDAFLTQFKRGKFDDGLLNGVQAIGLTLTVAAKNGKLAVLETTRAPEVMLDKRREPSTKPSKLLVRNHARLTLEGARAVIAGAEAKAAELNVKENIAVVDDGGHLIAFSRMDGARPASGYTAITKAASAATFRTATGPLLKGSAPPDPLLNLSLQNAAAVSGGKITTLLGGVPIMDGEQVIGAIGVGGATGEQDAEVAKAGIDAFKLRLVNETNEKD